MQRNVFLYTVVKKCEQTLFYITRGNLPRKLVSYIVESKTCQGENGFVYRALMSTGSSNDYDNQFSWHRLLGRPGYF